MMWGGDCFIRKSVGGDYVCGKGELVNQNRGHGEETIAKGKWLQVQAL